MNKLIRDNCVLLCIVLQGIVLCTSIVLQESVLSLHCSTFSPRHPNTHLSKDTKILSCADDITITSTHAKQNTAATNAQHYYLNTLQTWLCTNRLKVAPEKFTVTLITNYKQEYNYNNFTPVTLYNTPIP